jgi:hypothetical protein
MADKGFVLGLLNSLQEDVRRVLGQAFQHVMDTGRLGGDTKALNFLWYRVDGTTHATAGTEFSVEHGMGTAPSKAIPVIDLTAINSQNPVLSVSRAPDARRVYFTSASTNAAFTLYLEP